VTAPRVTPRGCAAVSPLCERTLIGAASLAGRIKVRPEDFLVEELPLIDPVGAGEHLHVGVQKTGIQHDELVAIVAEHFQVPPWSVGHAGMKDRNAVTRQTLSVHRPGRSDPRPLEHPQVQQLWAARHSAKLRVGQLQGNRFAIRVRDIDPTSVIRVERDLRRLAQSGLPNAFGPQRFGRRLNGHRLGLLLVRRQWQAFLDELLDDAGAGDPPDRQGRREAYRKGEFRAAIAHWARRDVAERTALHALSRGAAPEQAVHAIAPRMRDFWICALQSAIFNAVLDLRLRDGTFDRLIPGDLAMVHEGGSVFRVGRDALADAHTAAELAGRLQRFEISPSGPLVGPRMVWGDDDMGALEAQAMDRIGVRREEMLDPALKPPGARRPLRIAVAHPHAESGVDEHGAFIRLCFELPGGAYATSVLHELFGGGVVEGGAASRDRDRDPLADHGDA
jgi:tRNA pseudouridine13 synthase